MREERTVRPRWVWAGMAGALIGAAVAGVGIIYWSLVLVLAGAVALAIGAAVAIRGGIIYDTHGARPLRTELRELREGEVHQGTAPGDMVDRSSVRHDAVATTRTAARVAVARDASPRPGLIRAGAGLLLAGAVFVLGAQGLYAHTPLGQDNAARDLGLAVIVGLVGLRLLFGDRPGRTWSILAVGGGLALLACAVLTRHDDTAGIVVEAVAGAWAVAAALMSLDHRYPAPGRARGRHA